MSKGKLRIRIDSSRGSPAGAEAAYILRRLAARAGAYAPGIQESLFYAIGQNNKGATLTLVGEWLRKNSRQLAQLGYHIVHRLEAVRSGELIKWVEAGEGYRAALLGVDAVKLYGDKSLSVSHAVALIRHDETSGIADDDLPHGVVMVDAGIGRPRFSKVPDISKLTRAHLQHKHQTILMYWTGHA